MRSRILTEYEKQILKDFLAGGTKREGFKMLLHRMRKNVGRLDDDMKLIHEAVKKCGESG